MKVNKEMKVCIVTSSNYETSPRVIRMSMSLAKFFDVEVVEFEGKRKTNFQGIINGIKIRKLGSPFWSKNIILKLIVFLWRVFPTLLTTKTDVYHCAGFPSIIVGIPMKMFFGKKVIYDCYEHYPYQLTAPALKRTLRQSIIWNAMIGLEGVLAKLSDYVLVVPSFEDILVKRFRRYKKNAVLEIWNLPQIKLLDKKQVVNKRTDVLTLLYVGGINEDSGIFKLLDAMSLVVAEAPRARVLLIGSLNQRDKLVKYIKQLHLENYVIISDPVPYSQVWNIYSCADIGLVLYQPTFWNLRSKASEKLFENMLFSLPIVVSNFPGLREIVKACDCGILVDPTDVKEISRKILDLIRNPEKASILGSNGRRSVLMKYNWESEEHKVIEIYRSFQQSLLNS
jgi:glycosyltransferase involved in cell wall biosynthesis